VPSQSYYAFATKAGCAPTTPYLKNGSTPIFECLVSKDSATLINASATVSQEGSYGTWAFLPVTDGIIVQDLPSRQLGRGKVNGLNMLVGNNAAEALFFTPQVITTEDELVAYLRVTFPLFSNNDIARRYCFITPPRTLRCPPSPYCLPQKATQVPRLSTKAPSAADNRSELMTYTPRRPSSARPTGWRKPTPTTAPEARATSTNSPSLPRHTEPM